MSDPLPPLAIRGVAAVLALAFFVVGATSGSLANSTDAIYAVVASDIAQRGAWLTPEVAGGPYLMKPPLYFWAVAVSVKLFGATAFAFRLPGVLSGWAVALLCAGIVARISGRKEGWFVGLGFALLSPTVFEFSRRIFMEETLAAGMMLALYAAVRARHEDDVRWLWLVGPASMIAILTKSYGGGFSGVAILAWLPLVGRPKWLISKPFLGGIALGAVPILAYVGIMLAAAPEPFLHQNLLPFRMGSAAQFSWYRTGKFFYFTQPFATDRFVFVGGLVGFLVGSGLAKKEEGLRGIWLLLLYVAVGYAVWGSLAQQRLYYLVPFLPAFSCALAVVVVRFLPSKVALGTAAALVILLGVPMHMALSIPAKMDSRPGLRDLASQVAESLDEGDVVFRYNDFFAATELYMGRRAIGLTPSPEMLSDFGRILVLGERDIARDGRPGPMFELYHSERAAGRPVHLVADARSLGLILPGMPELRPRAFGARDDGTRLWFASTSDALPVHAEGPRADPNGYPVALRWLADHKAADLPAALTSARTTLGDGVFAEVVAGAGLTLGDDDDSAQ